MKIVNINSRLDRESNAELLRILAMLMILLHHFAVHALYREVLLAPASLNTWDQQLVLFMHGFFYIGVNVFVLISGYYGIKTKCRSFFNIYITYAFYQVLYSVRVFAGILKRGDDYTIGKVILDSIARIIMPFGNGDLWFLDCYLALFLIAPLLNVAIQNINKQQHAYILILLTIVNVYLGFFQEKFHNNGYTVSQFVYIYMIGSYLHNYVTANTIRTMRWKYLLVYVICGVLWGGIKLLNAHGYKTHYGAGWVYNSPLLLLMSISFFLFIMSFHFKSKAVNWIAASTLGVYIINELVVKYNFVMGLQHRYSPTVNLLIWVGISIGFFVFAVLADKIRVVLLKPVWTLHDKLQPKICNLLSIKHKALSIKH